MSPSGEAIFLTIPALPPRHLRWQELLRYALPQRGLDAEINRWRMANLRHFWRGLKTVALAQTLGLPTIYGRLYLEAIRADGRRVPYGLASLRVVTTVGVNFIVDAFQNTVEVENMKYHGVGTGGTAEAVGDTALVTELTTQYNPDNTRATGSLTEGATANIFRTVGTNTFDASVALVEHGIFDQAATGGGVLLDRTVFATINLGSGDSLQSTYDLTLTAGS